MVYAAQIHPEQMEALFLHFVTDLFCACTVVAWSERDPELFIQCGCGTDVLFVFGCSHSARCNRVVSEDALCSGFVVDDSRLRSMAGEANPSVS